MKKREHVSCCNSWRQKCNQERNRKDPKIWRPLLQIQRKWYVKAEVIPVITGATRTISKSLKQYLSNVLGEHEIKEPQKNNHRPTVHCTRTSEISSVKVQNIRGRVHKFPAWPTLKGDRNETTLLFFNIISLYFNTLFTSVNVIHVRNNSTKRCTGTEAVHRPYGP